MRVICPECDLEDEVDPASVTPDTRFVCARCSTNYQVFRDEEAASAPPTHEPETILEMSAPQNEEMFDSEPDAQSGDPLIIPEEISSVPVEEEIAVLEELFMNSSAPQEEETRVEEIREEAAHEEAPCVPVEPVKAEEQRADALLNSESPDVSVAPESGSDAESVSASVVPAERYTEGVRLMRVSPTRLFMGGVSFVFLIMVCNLMVSPAMRAGKASNSAVAELGQVSNQSSNRSIQVQPAHVESEPVRPPSYVQEIQPASQPTSTPTTPPQPVIVAATPQPTPTPAPAVVQPAQTNEDGRFTVQVGSYNEPGQAEERAAKLRAAGFATRVVRAEIPNRGTWYRVQAGRFQTRDEATRYGAQIRSSGAADAAVVVEAQ